MSLWGQSWQLTKTRDEAIKKAELLFQALDADGDGSLTQVGSVFLQLILWGRHWSQLSRITKYLNIKNFNNIAPLFNAKSQINWRKRFKGWICLWLSEGWGGDSTSYGGMKQFPKYTQYYFVVIFFMWDMTPGFDLNRTQCQML